MTATTSNRLPKFAPYPIKAGWLAQYSAKRTDNSMYRVDIKFAALTLTD